MTQSTEATIVTRVRALAQHELGHFVAAIALGLEGQEVTFTIHPTEVAHRGKSRVNNVIRCETLAELRELMHKRAVVLLAGVMGETISRSSLQVDMREALRLLEQGETGAALDHATAKELAQLLDNSAPEIGSGILPPRGAGSMKVFQELFTHAATVVQMNAESICTLADMLAARVKISEREGVIEASLASQEMEQTAAFQAICSVQLSQLALG